MAKKSSKFKLTDLAATNYRHKIDGSYTRDCKSYLNHKKKKKKHATNCLCQKT